MDTVVAENLHKHYDGIIAVRNVNFKIRDRECFGFLGPNGAGKTSLVKMIYGFLPVTSGKLTVFGIDVKSNIRIKRLLGVVSQDNNLDSDLKAIQNLLVYASFFGIEMRLARERAEELLEFFGLTEKTDQTVDSPVSIFRCFFH